MIVSEKSKNALELPRESLSEATENLINPALVS